MAQIHEATPALPLDFRLQGERMLLKAQPSVEGGQRVLYMEASTEVRDLQDEKVLLSALQASIPYFLKFGRLDLDHASVTGQIRGTYVNPYAYEIGKPLDVRVDGNSIYVKAAIWSSSDKSNRWTEAADLFWDSLHTNPPVPWFPSVAGDVFAEAPVQEDGRPVQEIRGLRWHSIGLSRTPVNPSVGPVSTMPMRAFAKAFGSAVELRRLLTDLGPQALTPKADGDPDIPAILRHLSRESAAGATWGELIAAAPSRGFDPTQVAAVAVALLLQPKGAL